MLSIQSLINNKISLWNYSLLTGNKIDEGTTMPVGTESTFTHFVIKEGQTFIIPFRFL